LFIRWVFLPEYLLKKQLCMNAGSTGGARLFRSLSSSSSTMKFASLFFVTIPVDGLKERLIIRDQITYINLNAQCLYLILVQYRNEQKYISSIVCYRCNWSAVHFFCRVV
jgi:hypothetical protein